MTLIKRCYGCGKVVWPWQDTVYTKLVGQIHKECAFNTARKYENDKAAKALNQRLTELALVQLNNEEKNG